MKISVIFLVIVTLLITIISPISLSVSFADSETPYLAELNVCHMGDAFLPGGTEVLYLFEYDLVQLKPNEKGRLEISYLLFADLFIPLQEDKPPRA